MSRDVSTNSDRPQKQGAKKLGRPPGTFGPHKQTLRIGRQVRDATADGLTVSYIAHCIKSRVDSDTLSPEFNQLAKYGSERDIAKRLRFCLKAADLADGREPFVPPAGPGVGYAQRAFQAHSAEHQRWAMFDAFSAARRDAPPAYWKSLAKRCELMVAFEHAMASASARPPSDWTKHLESLIPEHLERASKGGGGESPSDLR